ncbi:proteinase-activated receptor 1 [Ochotona princeps]|uniref:proteinase-activated receptor 1 n=1 Tax=Ochotona princeps TaxID=9978 RepID=UPI0027145E1E|nr:proteinase-activated receptor 1 [Ochotona princeps]
MGPRRLLLLAAGLSLCWPLLSARAPSHEPEPDAGNDTVGPRTFFLRDSSHGFEPFPWEEDEEKNVSTPAESRLSPGNRSLPPSVSISQEASEYLGSPWLRLFVPTVYTGVLVVSLPLNLTAIAVFLLRMKVKKPAVVYMLHLATADVLFTAVLPFKISYYYSGSDWRFGPELCRVVTAAFYCNMYASIMLMTAISVDRFLAVLYPMQSLSWRTLGRASLVCLAIWALALAGVVPLLLQEQTVQVPGLNLTTCHDVLSERLLRGFYAYYFSAFATIFFFVPLAICTVCYASILRCLSSSAVSDRGRKSRALLLSAAVFCIFLLCFGPTNVLLVLHYSFLPHGPSTEAAYFAYLLCVCVSSVSCCLDPLLYYFASSECQRQLCSLLCHRDSADVASCNSSGQLMASKGDTSSHLNRSVYKKLLAA